MSTLHERLLAELDRLDPHRLTTLGKVTAAVLELHAPRTHFDDDDSPRCDCGQDGYMAQDGAPWPCSTIQAIARELGVDGGE